MGFACGESGGVLPRVAGFQGLRLRCPAQPGCGDAEVGAVYCRALRGGGCLTGVAGAWRVFVAGAWRRWRTHHPGLRPPHLEGGVCGVVGTICGEDETELYGSP